MEKETYIGDGVYVSFDGYQVWLRADENRIALEREVYGALLAYVERLKPPANDEASTDVMSLTDGG